LNRKSDQFVEYLKHMSQKKALVEDSEEQRLTDFARFFGEDLEKLNSEFVRYIQKLR